MRDGPQRSRAGACYNEEVQSHVLQQNAVESAILLRLSERSHQLAINAQEAKASTLTEGELAAIVANAANIDRMNLADLSARPGVRRADPVGATDLTNEINEPTQRVSLHPALSLMGDLAYLLEQRNAPAEICREGRELAHLLEAKHLAQLKHAGLAPAWPSFRADWEASLAKAGYIDWSTYGPNRPRAGCSPEYLLDVIAKQNGLVPEFGKLDRVMVRGEIIAEGKASQVNMEVEEEKQICRNRQRIEEQLAGWEKFVGVAESTYSEQVEGPMCARSKAWFYTTKDLSRAEMNRVTSFCGGVHDFAKTLPPVEQSIVRQAANTAATCVIGPSVEEEIIKKGLGFGQKITEKVLEAGADKGIEMLGEKGAEIAGNAVLAGSVALSGGVVGGLLYFIGKGAAKMLFPKVTGKAEDLVHEGIGKVVGWAKSKSQNLVYEESRVNETEISAKLALDQHSETELPVKKVVTHLTPAGARAARLLGAAYAESVDVEKGARFVEYAGASESPGDTALALATMVNPELPPHAYKDVVGFGFDFAGSKLERVQASRMAAAAIIESHLGVTEAVGRTDWVKGKNRLNNSLANAKGDLSDITALESASTSDDVAAAEEFENKLENDCVRILAEGTRAQLRPMGDRFVFSGRSVSRLLGCSEHAYERESGVKVPNRSDTDDYSVLMLLNQSLWSQQMSVAAMNAVLDETRSYELRPASLVQPPSLAEDLAVAELSRNSISIRPGLVN